MHLKSLTLKGFKSFASATTLQFEPGITCVVGPNGSGKSNVIDAIAWVLGEQGARTLRGGSMADVIFAGTSGRAPLGRAEVSLTIDNSDGAVAIPHAELTLTRTMFRGGGSEYAINGQSARLLDVVELLSDAGVGREMHVIVGQNSLDTVLAGSPQDRRALLEEAAGVLKHRKRKEKALRKLEAMQGNLTRLQDLTTEVRRQLTPLGRQAEAARKAVVLQADFRDASLRLLADDLVQAEREVTDREAAEAEARGRREAFEREIATLREREVESERAVAAQAERVRQATATNSGLAALRERLKGTAALAAERGRSAEELRKQQLAGELRDPQELAREAEAGRRREEELRTGLASDRERLASATTSRQTAEAALAEAEGRRMRAARAAADAREQRARLTGELAALRGRIESREGELTRLAASGEEALARAAEFRSRAGDVEAQVRTLDEGERQLKEAYETSDATLKDREARVHDLRQDEREAERALSAAGARREALRLALASRASADVLRNLPGAPAGPPMSELLTVVPGYETAVAAALGALAEAHIVPDLAAAVACLDALREAGAGGGSFIVLDGPEPAQPQSQFADLAKARPLREVVSAKDAATGPALRRLLATSVLVESADEAAALLARIPGITAVTEAGDVFSPGAVRGAATGGPTALELQVAASEAEQEEAVAAEGVTAVQGERTAAEAEVAQARKLAEEALFRLHQSDAKLAAVSEQLGQWGSSSRAAEAEAARAQSRRAEVEAALVRDREALPALEARVAGVQTPDGPSVDVEDDETVREMSAACTLARQAEVEARLAVRVTEERIAVEQRRSESAHRAFERQREARAELERRRIRADRESAVAGAVAAGAARALAVLEEVAGRCGQDLQESDQVRTALDLELGEIRQRLTGVRAEQEAVRSAGASGEVQRIEARLRYEGLQARAREEFSLEPETLVESYGPDVPIPTADDAAENSGDDTSGDEVSGQPYVRAEQEDRRRRADKALAALGKVNPLALEEFAALEERHTFLAGQIEDLKATRRDLMALISEVDERVEQIFASAFADVARQFEQVFSRLFPGGEGRLVLTEPGDMLQTGIEVEARPPGKRVKRLSLLSGGERSLTALAFLVALFQARPSPFYVLDEVEAALDDVNLGRLIGLFDDLRAKSQLVIITHQKRTMEIADSLYGVSMRGDGVSAVIGQRMREAEPA